MFTLYTTSENDDIPSDTPRPTTPLPDQSRTLRRTISYASIDTVCPPKSKGIRRRIEEIAENLKPKSTSTNKKKKRSSAQDVSKNTTKAISDSKASPEGKPAKRGRKPTSQLRNSSYKSEEASVLAIADRLHSGVPCEFELDPPLAISGCKSESLIDVPLFKDEVTTWENRSFPIRTLALEAHVTAEDQEDLQSPPTTKADIEDLQFDIRSSETDVTIWDGLEASVFFISYTGRSGQLTRELYHAITVHITCSSVDSSFDAPPIHTTASPYQTSATLRWTVTRALPVRATLDSLSSRWPTPVLPSVAPPPVGCPP